MALDPTALGRITSAVPGSIREAARSPLGFAALGIIAVSLLAYAFFGNSSDSIKMVVFFSVIGCLVFFFVAVHFASPVHLAKPGALIQPPASPPRDGRGRFTASATRASQSSSEAAGHE